MYLPYSFDNQIQLIRVTTTVAASAIASVEATEAAALVVFFYCSCLEKLKIIPINSKNDEHKEKFFLFREQ